MVANAKIQYRASLLSATIDAINRKRTTNQVWQKDAEHGKWGIQDGQLPHVGDAMQLFNRSWNALSPKTVIKCWIKRNCLAEGQVEDLNSTLIGASSTNGVDIDLTSTMVPDQVSTELPMGRHVAAAIQNSLSELNSVCDTP